MVINGQEMTAAEAKKAVAVAAREEKKMQTMREEQARDRRHDCEHSIERIVSIIGRSLDTNSRVNWHKTPCEPKYLRTIGIENPTILWTQSYTTSNGSGTVEHYGEKPTEMIDSVCGNIAVKAAKGDTEETWYAIGCAGGECTLRELPPFLYQFLDNLREAAVISGTN